MAILVKIGALAMDIPRARGFVQAVREAARVKPIVLFPGGGTFADEIRRIDRLYSIGADAAHWLAIHAMDTTGLLLASTCPGVSPVAELPALQRRIQQPYPLATDGLPEVPVWLPFKWCQAVDPAPHSWDVTSDSLAVLAGAKLEVAWVGLAKLTDQLGAGIPFSACRHIKARELDSLVAPRSPSDLAHEWAVDAYLPQAVQTAGIPCKVFDARMPQLFASLVVGKTLPGSIEIMP